MFYSKIYEQFYSFRQRSANALIDFFNFLPNRWYLGAILIIQGLSWFLAYYIYRNLSGDLLVLHYNVDFGISWVGDPNNIFYFPVLSFLFLLVSVFLLLLKNTGRHLRFHYHLIMSSLTLASMGMAVALTLIYLINFK